MGITPDVTRELFNKAKQYAYSVMQTGKGIVDADRNDGAQCLFWLIHDLAEAIGTDGAVGSGFSVVENSTSKSNNFALTAGFLYVDGLRLYQGATVGRNLTASSGWAARNLSSVFSVVGTTTASDERMNWTGGVHLNKTVLVLRTSDMNLMTYTVSANSSTTLTFQPGDDLALNGIRSGDPYCVVMSTPAINRADLICLNCSLDYADSDEDEELLHTFASGIESDVRRKIRSVIEVVEAVSVADPAASLPSSYTDASGVYHRYKALAMVYRFAGTSNVETADITDLRTTLHQLNEFVLRAGDTMEGDLNFDVFRAYGSHGDIDFNNGELDGFDHVKADALHATDKGSDAIKMTAVENDSPAPGHTSYTGKITQYDEMTGWILGRLQTAYPVENADVTTKEYVDHKITNHSHGQYLERDTMNNAMNRIDGPDIVTLLGAANFGHGDSCNWVHGLGSDFLLMQVLFKPSSGSDVGVWVDGSGLFTLAQIDEDTVRIRNDTDSDIAAVDVRVSVMLTQLSQIMSVTDSLVASTFVDSYEGLVT